MHMRHALHVFIYLLSTPTYLHVSLSSFISGTIKLKSMKIVKAVKRMKKLKGTLKTLEGCKNVKVVVRGEGDERPPPSLRFRQEFEQNLFFQKALNSRPNPLTFRPSYEPGVCSQYRSFLKNHLFLVKYRHGFY